MQTFKQLNEILKLGKRSLHLAANSTLFDNSCWELRKQARQSETTVNSSRHCRYDQQFYRPRSLNSGLISDTWLARRDNELANDVADDAGIDTDNTESEYRSKPSLGDRLDLIHYKPMRLKDRCYSRTWTDFEDLKVKQYIQPYVPLRHTPARKKSKPLKEYRQPITAQRPKPQFKKTPTNECFRCQRVPKSTTAYYF